MEIHVVVGVVTCVKTGRVLIAKRPLRVHQGGKWEFPGGKVQSGETARQALARELFEEIGIEVTDARPLLQFPYAYKDRTICLDAWHVLSYQGVPVGKEGQRLAWVDASEFVLDEFPPANRTLLTAIQLPDCYLITPDPPNEVSAWPVFLRALTLCFQQGVRLIQLRAHGLSDALYRQLALEILPISCDYRAQVLLNRDLSLALSLGASGVHWSQQRLKGFLKEQSRLGLPLRLPAVPGGFYHAISCHAIDELQRAQVLGADFVALSCVFPSASHPGVPGLGWSGFQRIVATSACPVFALGGVGLSDLPDAWRAGAQGVAGISRLWRRADGGKES